MASADLLALSLHRPGPAIYSPLAGSWLALAGARARPRRRASPSGSMMTRMDADSDELDLIRAAARGDARAQAILVRANLARVHSVAYRIVLDAQIAEDIAQETFLRAWKALPGWEPRARLSTWLHTVALNLARDHLRRKREALSDALPERIDTALRPDERLDQSQRIARMETAIASLPERQREALTLCAMEGHTNISAAEIMGVSVEALESLLARARRRLKTRLFGGSEGQGT